jgi:hypothetical protein
MIAHQKASIFFLNELHNLPHGRQTACMCHKKMLLAQVEL